MRNSGVISGGAATRFPPETSGHNAGFENVLRQLLFSRFIVITHECISNEACYRNLCVYILYIYTYIYTHIYLAMREKVHENSFFSFP